MWIGTYRIDRSNQSIYLNQYDKNNNSARFSVIYIIIIIVYYTYDTRIQ